jgi:hypothetical protein
MTCHTAAANRATASPAQGRSTREPFRSRLVQLATFPAGPVRQLTRLPDSLFPFRSMLMIRRAFLVLFVVALCAPAFGGDLEVGAKAPDFKGLPGTDGKEYGLSSMKDAKVVVVCFTCNQCPMSVNYEDRFVEFNKK